MPDSLTKQQQTAVEHRDTSIVLASGAGCGKTHVLTERYLSHLNKHEAAVGQIVAITFTERAARELRSRIRNKIELMQDSSRHLRDLETAPIATFHSFCGNLLRQFAIPAGLDPALEVLDDVLSTTLRSEAINSCLRRLLSHPEEDPETAQALRDLIIIFGYPAVVGSIDSLVMEADRSSWKQWLEKSPEAIASEWVRCREAHLLPAWTPYVCAAAPKIARCLKLLEHVASPNPEVVNNVQRLLHETPKLHEANDRARRIEELKELAKVRGSGKKAWPDPDIYEAVKKAFEGFRDDLPARFELFTAETTGLEEAARYGQLFIRVASAAEETYRRHKRRSGVVDFQDLLTLTRDLLKQKVEVREALRQRYRFVLLDELQDTDPVQMELVELLVGPAQDHNKLFAVGDHKQSIYRFRGAEVELFKALRKTVGASGQQSLTENFRSQPEIIHFVNVLFSKRLADYEALQPHSSAAAQEACVEFLWTPPGEVVEASGRGGRSSVSALRSAEGAAIARRIRGLLGDPSARVKPKDGAARRVECKDIVLLFRSMSHVAIYESALREAGLDYYLVGGRAFFAQQEIYDLLNLLSAVENPQDSTCLVGALRSPFFNLSDESIFLLAAHEDGPWAGLHDRDRLASLPPDQQPAARRAAEWLSSWREVKDQLPIARLINRIVADSGYDAALQFEFLGDRKFANLWKLIDLARSFDRSGLFGLHEFIARLRDLVVRQPREEMAATVPENADVVKLMSIHQAKGLEYPVVFIPDFAAQGRGDRNPSARWHRGLGCLVKLPAEFELPSTSEEDGEGDTEREAPPFSKLADELGRAYDQLADWQEDLRVLYVACTRARDLLILSAGLPAPLAHNDHLPANHWTMALEERFDVRTGRLAEGVFAEHAPMIRVVSSAETDGPALATRPPVPPPGESQWKLPSPSRQAPRMVSLPALEALARGERVPHLDEQFDTEDDGDCAGWRTFRDRLGSLSPADSVLWSVLERWNFADVDGWVQLLTDALEESADSKIANELGPKLRGFAGSSARSALAAAEDLRRGVEFVANPTLENDSSSTFSIRGVIDFLYRGSAGWHILGIDRGVVLEDDPWRGRRLGLVLQAWAASEQLGEWPRAVELFDLSTGQLVRADPKRIPVASAIEHFRRLVNRS